MQPHSFQYCICLLLLSTDLRNSTIIYMEQRSGGTSLEHVLYFIYFRILSIFLFTPTRPVVRKNCNAIHNAVLFVALLFPRVSQAHVLDNRELDRRRMAVINYNGSRKMRYSNLLNQTL